MTTQSKSTHRGAGEGTIYKDTARNRWVAQVTVGYDGRTGRLIRRSKSARTRKEAQAALDERREELLRLRREKAQEARTLRRTGR